MFAFRDLSPRLGDALSSYPRHYSPGALLISPILVGHIRERRFFFPLNTGEACSFRVPCTMDLIAKFMDEVSEGQKSIWNSPRGSRVTLSMYIVHDYS